jgi:hypothetical protein
MTRPLKIATIVQLSPKNRARRNSIVALVEESKLRGHRMDAEW